jgi:DNA helicase HerA-like ATPase
MSTQQIRPHSESSRSLAVSVPAQAQERAMALPDLLQFALERRWYENFDASTASIGLLNIGHLTEAVPPVTESRFLNITGLSSNSAGQNLPMLNMQNVLSSFRDGSHSLAFALRGHSHQVGLYMGVRCLQQNDRTQTADYAEVLRRALRGNFPGIDLSPHYLTFTQGQEEILSPLTDTRYLAAITGIPSLKRDATAHFTQSLDRLVEALQGEEYTLLVLAEPILETVILEAVQKSYRLSSEIHAYVKRSINASQSENEDKTVSSGEGSSLGIGTGLLSMLFNMSWSKQTNRGTSERRGLTTGRSETREILNKSAEFCEKLLDKYLERLQHGRNLGFWNVGLYLSSDNPNTFLRAQGVVRGLFSGEETHFEPLRLLDLSDAPDVVKESLHDLRNPALNAGLLNPLGEVFQTLGTPLNTRELSILMSLPQHEISGVKLRPMADFNLNPPQIQGFKLGHILHQGEELSTPVAISEKSLKRHTFITGLTGSGKTNSCLALLVNAYQNRGLNFMVIDPAKTEYRFLLYANNLGRDLTVFTLGDESAAPFRLNPFEFVPGFPLLTHIDLIKAVFNAAFPMYGPMPYLLEKAILAVYQERGWDIVRSTNRFIKNPMEDYSPYLPCLRDLYDKIDAIVNEQNYGDQLARDISAALKARLGSLLNGGKGRMLNTHHSIPMIELLNRPVVLELRRIGDDDEKAFVMGLLFIMLYEACQSRPPDNQLHHVTLIEEAHRLLRNVAMGTSAETANPRGKAVEMFTDMMAEMRVYGEGFIIVDQVPGKLVPDVIKGSDLKLVHRLTAQDDRLAVGNAMGLTPAQLEHLPRLKVGQAIVHSEELEEACWVKIDPIEDELAIKRPGQTPAEQEQSGLERLQEQSRTFYTDHPELLHRYPADKLCPRPRLHLHDLDWSKSQAIELARQVVVMLLVGQPTVNDLTEVWRSLQNEVDRILRRYYRDEYTPALIDHALIDLAVETAQSFYEYYSHINDWRALLELQTGLAKLWLFQPPTIEIIIQLRHSITTDIAIQPKTYRAGCVSCPRPCLFGFHFQTKNQAAVQKLNQQIKINSDPKRTPDFQNVANLAVQSIGIGINPNLRPLAAYCLLTQATDNQIYLKLFHQQVSGKPA